MNGRVHQVPMGRITIYQLTGEPLLVAALVVMPRLIYPTLSSLRGTLRFALG